MNEESTGGVAQAVKSYGALAASVLQLLGVIVYVSHWEATVDQRLTAVESAQAAISANMSRLDGAREADQIHLAHVDDKIGDMATKVSAIFDIMTGGDQTSTEAPVGDPAARASSPPINFPRPQGRGH